MRFILTLLVTILFIFAAVVASGAFYAHQHFHAPLPYSETKIIHIQPGSSLIAVISKLEKSGVFEHSQIEPLLFRLGVRMKGLHRSMKAGEYEIAPSMSMAEITHLLASGQVIMHKVTIPEGLTSFEIVQLLNAHAGLSGDAIEVIPQDGSLLPETYYYARGMSRSDILARMRADMRIAIEELWPQKEARLPFDTIEQALVLASIIEKETGVAHERRKISGVFVNRLRRGMRLQTDPTVIYAITKGEHKNDGMGPLGRRILKKDLEIDSPYNTYRYKGLPPGPIANPGRAAIEAALHPEEHSYLYFVATANGGHNFARSLNEHNRNVREWRRSK